MSNDSHVQSFLNMSQYWPVTWNVPVSIMSRFSASRLISGPGITDYFLGIMSPETMTLLVCWVKAINVKWVSWHISCISPNINLSRTEFVTSCTKQIRIYRVDVMAFNTMRLMKLHLAQSRRVYLLISFTRLS